MEIQYCEPSTVYLVFIDSTDYKKSHLLKVEIVLSMDGIETYLIPIEYANCEAFTTEEEGMHAIVSHYKTICESCKNGLFSERIALTNEYSACVGHDAFTKKRKTLILNKIKLVKKTEISLIQICTYTYPVETFSGRYATGHSLDDIEPN